jgi:hypothetical protein
LTEVGIGEGEGNYSEIILVYIRTKVEGRVIRAECKLTFRLGSLGGKSVADLSLVLEIEVPGGFFAARVLQVEGDDGVGLLEGIFAVGFVGLERLVDDVEGGG